MQQQIRLELIARFAGGHEVNKASAAYAAQPRESLIVNFAFSLVQWNEMIHGCGGVATIPAYPARLCVHPVACGLLHVNRAPVQPISIGSRYHGGT